MILSARVLFTMRGLKTCSGPFWNILRHKPRKAGEWFHALQIPAVKRVPVKQPSWASNSIWTSATPASNTCWEGLKLQGELSWEATEGQSTLGTLGAAWYAHVAKHDMAVNRRVHDNSCAVRPDNDRGVRTRARCNLQHRHSECREHGDRGF